MIKKFIIPEKAHKEAASESSLSFAFSRGTIKVVDMPEKVIELYVPETGGKRYSVNITRTSNLLGSSVENDSTIPLSSLGELIKAIQTVIQDTYVDGTPFTHDVIVDITDDTISLEIYDDYRE